MHHIPGRLFPTTGFARSAATTTDDSGTRRGGMHPRDGITRHLAEARSPLVAHPVANEERYDE